MAINITKPTLNMREELAALKRNEGLKGLELLNADTADQARDLIGARGRKNLIINGAMQVAQRGTSFTGITSGQYFLDRYRVDVGTLGTYTISQDSNAPDGFANSLKVDCTTADASPAAGDSLLFYQRIEAQDLQGLKYGSASAETLTLSFWVKSNKTGTGQVNWRVQDSNRNIAGTYTIDAADTWEKKTITVVGDTSGSINDDNGWGIQLEWWLDSGSTYTSGAVPTAWEALNNADRNAGGTLAIGDNAANYWQITGIQLEVGSTATDFEHRSYGEELALCQRYFQRWGTLDVNVLGLAGQCISSSAAYFVGQTIIPMRTIPTGSVINVTNFRVRNATSSGVPSITGLTVSTYSETEYMLYASGASGLAAGDASHLLAYTGTNRGYVDFDAEL